jgi:hypothetical protein
MEYHLISATIFIRSTTRTFATSNNQGGVPPEEKNMDFSLIRLLTTVAIRNRRISDIETIEFFAISMPKAGDCKYNIEAYWKGKHAYIWGHRPLN